MVWHSAKEYLAHRLFESVEQLESLLHKLLNEGDLIIEWDINLKNKGNKINAVLMQNSLLPHQTKVK